MRNRWHLDFLGLRGDGIVARLLDRIGLTDPAEPSESARRCIGRSGDLREPSPEKAHGGDRSKDRLSRAAKSPKGYLRSTLGKRDARTGARLCG